MSGQGYGYHVGYETTKAYQAEMRALSAQDRRARQALAARQAGEPSRLAALLRNGRMRRWMTKLGQGTMSESGAPRDLPTAPR